MGNLFGNPSAEGNKGGDGTMGQGLVFVLKVFALNGPIGAFVSLCHQVNALIVAGQIQRFPYRRGDFLMEPNLLELGSVHRVVFQVKLGQFLKSSSLLEGGFRFEVILEVVPGTNFWKQTYKTQFRSINF